jgi:Family of unknown function (DUF6503)
MKKIAFASIIVLLLVACKNDSKEKTTVIETLSKEDITTSLYPESITKVFDAHGGIDKWNKMQTLSFTMEKPDGKEITTTDLKSRAELIDFPTHSQGYDGESIWIKEKEGYDNDGSRAKFYRGLMMYFYTMPFIVGDSGIIYEDIEPLTFEEKSYPGVLISYEAGIGSSPDDQYGIYYNSETGQMEWLSYTVTFGKDGKSNDFRYIRYNDWQTINGLVLPKSISWYKYEDNTPTELSKTIEFKDVVLSEKAPEISIFKIPEGGKVIE